MSAFNLELDERSTWIHCTPGDYTLAQPFYATEYGDFLAAPGFAAARGACDGLDLLYAVSGTGLVEQGKRRLELAEGQAVLAGSADPLAISCAAEGEPWHVVWVRLNGAGAARLAGQYGTAPLHAVELDGGTADACLASIRDNLDVAGIIASETVSLAAHRLLLALLAAAQASTGTFDEAFARVHDLVESSYAGNVTLDDLADTAQMSKPNLMKAFKRLNGGTPYEYVLRHRINCSKRLLAETGERVSAIAEAVGFNSESNFSFRFSKIVGMSPRAYRASCFSHKE